MEKLRESHKNGILHHAYALQGEKSLILPKLFRFFEKDLKIDIQNNVDFHLIETENLTIDDARDLQDKHLKKALSSKKIFVIVARFITIEAQNALLKILEEPTADTHFFLIMPNTKNLLPTFRSRLIEIMEDSTEENMDLRKNAKRFLESRPAERIVQIKSLVEEKDKGKAIDFVKMLEMELYKKERNKNILQSLNEILIAKKYLHDRSPSVKLILEHLCLSI